MPRRTPDQGVKPFEFRTGVGGLPPLGGIFRAGDPATVPPNKHHMVINARITPGGLYSRPGMTQVFNTGVVECITGLTEVSQLGGGLLLWPGCEPDTLLHTVSMRMVFPNLGLSSVYSEYVFLAEGETSEIENAAQPIVDFFTDNDTTLWGSGLRPFIHRGQLHYWSGSPPSLFSAQLPEASGVQGTDVYRQTACYDGSGAQVAALPTANTCPPGTSWPRGHPFSTAELVVSLPANPFGTGETVVITEVLSLSERGDEALSGTASVDEALYALAVSATLMKLYRWDGVSLTVEAVSFSGPFSARMIATGSGGICVCGPDGEVWLRGDNGAWGAIGPLVYDDDTFDPKGGFSWNGVPYFLGLGANAGAPSFRQKILLVRSDGTDLDLVHDFDFTDDLRAHEIKHVIQIGQALYFLRYGGYGDWTWLPFEVIHYDIPSDQVVTSLLVRPTVGTWSADAEDPFVWLQSCGPNLYLGGRVGWDLALQTDEPEFCHVVYDITDLANPVQLYRILESDQPESQPYSIGALPLVPGPSDTGQRDEG